MEAMRLSDFDLQLNYRKVIELFCEQVQERTTLHSLRSQVRSANIFLSQFLYFAYHLLLFICFILFRYFIVQ